MYLIVRKRSERSCENDKRLYNSVSSNAGVAQLVEHLTCNQGVASSNPAAGTSFR